MKLLLIDGYSLLFRAYFSSPALTTKSGQPTGAIYGFVRMLMNLLDEASPEYFLVAMDAHGPTFRHDSFEAYKAHRTAAPDDLKIQTGLARELLDGLSLPHYEHAGFEADDILGTLSCLGARENLDVTIVTGDGDALQLASEKVSVMLTRKGVSDLECYTPEAVHARFGFAPKLVPDYKGLRGDSSDNIPGVPGIGEKTAMKLVGEFGSLDNLFEKIEEVTPPRIRDLLKQHKAIALQSRDLARIVTDLPLDIPLEFARLPEMDEMRRERALETVREFEFKFLMRRYASGEKNSEKSSAPQTSGETGSTPSPEEIIEASPLGELKPEITRAKNFDEVRAWFGSTRALQDGASFVFHDNRAALACGEQALVFEGAIEDLKNWLQDESPKIVHDAKNLKLEMSRRKIKISGLIADTMLMSYLLEPTRQQHPLSTLARKQLSIALPDLDAPPEPKIPASKKSKKKSDSLFEEPSTPDPETEKLARELEAQKERDETARLENALAQHAVAVSLLEPILRAELQRIGEEHIFEELELPLVDILVSMEQLGMLLDPIALEKLAKELEADAARLQAEIWGSVGEEFNIGSPKQLQVILFEKLGLAKGRANKSGFSTDVHTLERLAEEHEVVRKILDYRGTMKLKSTYTDALLANMDARTHRIHTNLNQTGTVSGRISSSNPNLQNIPIRTEQGRHIRRAFIAPPEHILLKADYSQIELRILAHITQDEPLVEAFRSGEDVHSRTAADLFDVKVEDVDAEMRRKAKMTNYAIAYGVSGFGLAKQLGTGSAGEAQAFIKKYFETLPGVKKYIDDTLEEARIKGYVETLMGRRRPLPEIHSPRGPERAGAERTAINHPVQGTAADIMKWAMLAVFNELKKGKFRARMTMQVHDELVFEVPHDEVGVLAPIVKRLMTQVPMEKLKLSVPLEVDVSTGQNWNDGEHLM